MEASEVRIASRPSTSTYLLAQHFIRYEDWPEEIQMTTGAIAPPQKSGQKSTGDKARENGNGDVAGAGAGGGAGGGAGAGADANADAAAAAAAGAVAGAGAGAAAGNVAGDVDGDGDSDGDGGSTVISHDSSIPGARGGPGGVSGRADDSGSSAGGGSSRCRRHSVGRSPHHDDAYGERRGRRRRACNAPAGPGGTLSRSTDMHVNPPTARPATMSFPGAICKERHLRKYH